MQPGIWPIRWPHPPWRHRQNSPVIGRAGRGAFRGAGRGTGAGDWLSPAVTSSPRPRHLPAPAEYLGISDMFQRQCGKVFPRSVRRVGTSWSSSSLVYCGCSLYFVEDDALRRCPRWWPLMEKNLVFTDSTTWFYWEILRWTVIGLE